MSGLRSVEEQLAHVLAAVRPTPPVRVPLRDAAGSTLHDALTAQVDIPVFDNSAMDGFAVRHAEVADAAPERPVHLTVVADLPAGTELDPDLEAGQAARIMTGSPVPASADAIVPFEDTAAGLADSLGEIAVLRAPQPAAHIRRRGADLRAGEEVIAAGTLLTPLQLSAAAAAGIAEAVVARRPRVAVVATGSELVPPGQPLRRGQIPESNSELLAGLVRDAGAAVVLRETVDDTDAAFLAVLAAAAEAGAEVVVTSGGVSEGAFEVVKNVLSGSDVAFTKVSMQPGKPQGFGRLADGALLFGLPGNPVSSAVSFEVFVRPALLRMQGRTRIHRPVLRLPAAIGWRTPPGRRQYLPAAIDQSDPARWTVRPATAGGSGSHLAGGLARAEAYAVVPAEVGEVAAGDPVDVMLVS
ncbi:MAG: molybdopterin molybdotransferase MoeA [Microbacterium sp.]|uniref:molybdopterin molybdotransferase MoeA n=1 Tax=Microbacterium sp. TaxID=51671 RepID=UPI0026377ACA|nr:gephyrin-like molybdotransferase Glp [Microbacterium sp.]MCX6502784.1 molybdopterin molybdotransferase MoeA [Microbacterium sp.]